MNIGAHLTIGFYGRSNIRIQDCDDSYLAVDTDSRKKHSCSFTLRSDGKFKPSSLENYEQLREYLAFEIYMQGDGLIKKTSRESLVKDKNSVYNSSFQESRHSGKEHAYRYQVPFYPFIHK